MDKNNLFPVFLKLEHLRILIVGGGYVGMEKLSAILQNSPATKIKLVATVISDEIKSLARNYPSINLIEKSYAVTDMQEVDLVFAAVNDVAVSTAVVKDANEKGLLVNAADKPDLCDFYLSSVVQKGNLKIAISTNGKSPTIAKRLKEVLQDALPNELDELLDNIQAIRNTLTGDFQAKVDHLNDLTKGLVEKK
ncbi:precorrin-2 dehydrogenase/sirohydrochlorin ferrochelatase family protein [Ferruginibacter sp. SUN002]|uniref:precorrin-2 dehydrogenase/sirohydrochlorin ferrochelatase family protein n=1 Tax=Ferruginibacter sp. SUN002 TaxID=2937789 RepID=UPI003D36DD2D